MTQDQLIEIGELTEASYRKQQEYTIHLKLMQEIRDEIDELNRRATDILSGVAPLDA